MADEDRHRIRCSHCELVQFVNSTKTCRRCKEPFTKAIPQPVVPTPAPVVAKAEPVVKVQGKVGSFGYWMPIAFYITREAAGLSQRQLADRAGIPRTYVSKIEQGGALPTAKNLFHLCSAMNVEPTHVLRMVEFLVLGE
jgi:DNA-binding XRE family transcriptional regulator